MKSRFLLLSSVLFIVGLLLTLPEAGFSQKPPPPVKPNPAAPVLNFTGVPGGQRGKTVELLLAGTNLADTTSVLLGTNGFPATNKDNTKLKVELALPADLPLGLHALRVATNKGMSNVRLFAVDDLPEVLKAESAKVKTTPQEIKTPCVVVGRLDNESSDWYRFAVQAGQRLSFDVLGRRLGGPIDPQMSIYHGKSGRELAHENDTPGCQNDPRLTFTFKEAGDYLVEVKDVLNRGGPDYGYRLRVGDFPCATTPLPMAIKRGSKTRVHFAGPHVEGVPPVEVDAPTDPAITTLWIAPKGANGLHGWPVALALSDHDELVEQEPNNEPAKANRVSVPGGITGRLMPGDDRDFFAFAAKKGQKVLIEAHTLELYSPSLVYLVLKNAKGAEVAKSNPAAPPPADQRIEATLAEDGDYVLEVQHLNYVGGPSEVYRITITPSEPTFDIVAGLDRWDVAAGSSLTIPLTINRKGHAGPVEVQVLGPTGIAGQATIAAGQNNGNVTLKVADNVPFGAHSISLEAKGVGKQLVDVRPHVSGSLNALPFPPRQLNTQLALAVRKGAPFELAVEPPMLKLPLGGKAKLKVTAMRRGYDGPIALEVKNLPANVKAGKAALDKGQNTVEIELTATEKTPLGPKGDVQVVGTATGLQAATPAFVVSVEKEKK